MTEVFGLIQFGVTDVQFFKRCVFVQPDTGIADEFLFKGLIGSDIDFFKIADTALVAILQAAIACEFVF